MKYYIGCKKNGFNPVSIIIRLLTFSKYSHCFIVTDIEKRELVEADGLQVLRYEELTDKVIKGADFFELKAEYEGECDYILMEKYIKSVLNTPYDYVDLLVLAIANLSGIWENLILKIIPTRKNALICSEFIQYAYDCAGIKLTKKKIATPKDIGKSKKLQKVNIENLL